MYSIISGLINFYKKPDLDLDQKVLKMSFWRKCYIVMGFWILTTPIIILLSAVAALSAKAFGYNGQTLNSEIGSEAFLYTVLSVGVYTPIIEEISSRLYISKRPVVFAAGLVCFLMFMVQFSMIFIPSNADFSTSQEFLANSIIWYMLGLVVFGIPLFWIVYSKLKKMEALGTINKLDKYASLMISVSILTFGFAHLVNFPDFHKFWYIAPFLIVPQLIGVLGEVYFRVKFGFFFSIFIHMINNTAFVVIIYITNAVSLLQWPIYGALLIAFLLSLKKEITIYNNVKKSQFSI